MNSGEELIAHASAVEVGGIGVLILGPSGAGKSELALDLISRGAMLVSDDRVLLRRDGDAIAASPPKPLEGLVEARGVGLLQVEFSARALIRLVVDLGEDELERLPPARYRDLLGVQVPLVHGRDAPGLAAAVHALLKSGGVRRAP